MLPIIQFLMSISAGLLISTQTMRIWKVANEEQESHIADEMDVSAIQMEPEQPYNMGSEQINAVLQQILSSDDNDLEQHPVFIGNVDNNNIKSDYVLGSESLNRMLEEMLASPYNDNNKLPHIEPAMQL